MVGVLFFYLPGLVAMALVSFSMPMVVLDGVGPVEALKRGWAHMREHASWHIPVWLILIVGMVAVQFTLVGIFFLYPLMMAYQLAAYRIAFGDTMSDRPLTV